MSSLPAAERRVCVVLDIEKYSSRFNPDHLAMQRQLLTIAERAIGHAQVRWAEVEREGKGDGLLMELPPGINEPQAIAGVINGMKLALSESNLRAQSSRRMRLRMALTQGIRHPGETGAVGDATIAACRLVDSKELRAAMAGYSSSARSLGVIVADDLYRDVVAHGYPGLDPAEFTEVQVEIADKGFAAKAWTYVPEPSPGRLLAAPSPRLRDSAAANAARRAAAPFGGVILGGILIEGAHHHPGDPHQAHPGDHDYHPGAHNYRPGEHDYHPGDHDPTHEAGYDAAHAHDSAHDTGHDASTDAGADGS
jgi:hypothetical protein